MWSVPDSTLLYNLQWPPRNSLGFQYNFLVFHQHKIKSKLLTGPITCVVLIWSFRFDSIPVSTCKYRVYFCLWCFLCYLCIFEILNLLHFFLGKLVVSSCFFVVVLFFLGTSPFFILYVCDSSIKRCFTK